jgi:hypothetical protein
MLVAFLPLFMERQPLRHYRRSSALLAEPDPAPDADTRLQKRTDSDPKSDLQRFSLDDWKY